MEKPLHILFVDDEEGFRETVTEKLVRQGYHVASVSSAEEALALVKEETFEVALVDILMPGMDGITLLLHLKNLQPLMEIIIITGYGSIESAVDAMRKGAYNYLTKPVKLAELEVQIQKAQEKNLLARHNLLQREELRLQRRLTYREFVSRSKAMEAVLALGKRVAASNSTILIEGETGTGKELVANLIHRKSHRSEKSFIVVNCGALPESLLERELFGHSKGAFTGATETKTGLIEVADGGTLFLDEIGEMSPQGQVALLRVLETGLFRRLGQSKEISVDVRIIAATNQNLDEAVQTGKFREDLYHRINVVRILIPPLRERKEDIPALAQYFLTLHTLPGKSQKVLSQKAMDAFLAYNWPGNVRELSNVIERACLVCEGKEITLEHLGLPNPSEIKTSSKEFLTLQQAEKLHVLKTLKAVNGDKKKAAKLLGISLRHIYRKIA